MKNTLLISLIIIGLSYNSQAQRKKDKLETKIDSLSYAIGVSFASSMKDQNIPDLNMEKLYMAIEDVLNTEEPKIDLTEAHQLIQSYMIELKEKQITENLIKANEFLEENKKREGVIVLPSGLQYEVLSEGSGESPVSTSTVKTHYKGILLDGTVFDSSYDRGEPLEFSLGRVIKGWQEALKLMKPGSKWKLYIHPDLGYGERATGSIPANSLLIFEIELLSVE